MGNGVEKKIELKSLIPERVVYYMLGILEVLLGFRFLFKLFGANPESGFVSFIYSVSGVFVSPFTTIFMSQPTPGIDTEAIMEFGTIIAMIVYALIAWGVVKLIVTIQLNIHYFSSSGA